MAELSNDGSGIGAVTSSAAGSSSDSRIGWSKGGSGSTASRMRATYSATGSGAVVCSGIGTQPRPGGDPLRCLRPVELDVTLDAHAVAERPVAGDREPGGVAQRGCSFREALVEVVDVLVEIRVESNVRQRSPVHVEHEV